MNERLIQEFIDAAAGMPQGLRIKGLVAMVAERCATICDIEAEEGGAAQAAATIRAAFVPPSARMNPIAEAVQAATGH